MLTSVITKRTKTSLLAHLAATGLFFVALTIASPVVISPAHAQQEPLHTPAADQPKPAPTTTATPTKTKLTDPLGGITIRQLVGRATSLFVQLSGSFALVAFVYGGFKMITAAGNEKKYSEGLNSLKWAVVGLLVIFGSYAVLTALFTALGTAAT